MIRTTENNYIIKMEIQMHLPQGDVFNFLHTRGYEVKAWLWKYTEETFPGGVEYHEKWTFTATRPGETQSEEYLYLNVLEREVKNLLNELK